MLHALELNSILLDALRKRDEISSCPGRVGKIWLIDLLIRSQSSPATFPMRRNQPSYTRKSDRSRHVAAYILSLRYFYRMSLFELRQSLLVFCSFAHDRDNDHDTGDE